MYGSWLINLSFSMSMFLLYFLLSFSTDYWIKSLTESLIAALVVFILSYLFRWGLAVFAGENDTGNLNIEESTAFNLDSTSLENTTMERTDSMDSFEVDQTTQIIKELLQD